MDDLSSQYHKYQPWNRDHTGQTSLPLLSYPVYYVFGYLKTTLWWLLCWLVSSISPNLITVTKIAALPEKSIHHKTFQRTIPSTFKKSREGTWEGLASKEVGQVFKLYLLLFLVLNIDSALPSKNILDKYQVSNGVYLIFKWIKLTFGCVRVCSHIG